MTIKLVEENQFPGGSVYHYEIGGQDFRFSFKVELEETVFPDGQVVISVRQKREATN